MQRTRMLFDSVWFKFDAVLGILLVISLFFDRFAPAAWNALLLIVVSVAGLIPVLVSASRAIAKRRVSIDLLASVALIASFLVYEWQSAAFINLMLTAARIFGTYTEVRVRSAITGILKLRPEKVRVKREATVEDIPLASVQVGDRVIVESGEHIAIDGTVEEGGGTVDQSSLTGESMPVPKEIRDSVWSGTLLVSGSLIVKTEKVGKDTTIEKTIALVENAGQEKAGIHTTADRFAAWYIGIILVSSGIIYFISKDSSLLLSFLLVACADDIAVATPMSLLASVGQAARRGVIIKGGKILEALARTRIVIVDKTGTLTLGKFAVQETRTFGTHTEEELMRYAAMTSAYSHHPIAQSIVVYLKKRNVYFEKPEHINEFPGKGITAGTDGKTVYSGNMRLMEESGVSLSPAIRTMVSDIEGHGQNANMLALDREPIGVFACADEMRPETYSAIARLKVLGMEKIIMLTGDNENVASRIAERVGIGEFHANMLPEQKLAFVRNNISEKKKVIMVGDGINDAASLALADVGIAMGAIGSDAAIEAADIALMKDDFSRIPETIELGRKTMRIIHQNFAVWGAVNIIGIVLVSLRILGPESASAYNFLTDFIPIMNAGRLFGVHWKPFRLAHADRMRK